MFQKIDVDKNGTVSYSEFYGAAMNKRELLRRDKIIYYFKIFDKDKNGKIGLEEF